MNKRVLLGGRVSSVPLTKGNKLRKILMKNRLKKVYAGADESARIGKRSSILSYGTLSVFGSGVEELYERKGLSRKIVRRNIQKGLAKKRSNLAEQKLRMRNGGKNV